MLETLHTGATYINDEEEGFEFAEMYRALEEYGGLPGLKGLTLRLDDLRDNLRDAEWVAGLGKLCLGVKQFCGDGNVGWAAVSRSTPSFYIRPKQTYSWAYHGCYLG